MRLYRVMFKSKEGSPAELVGERTYEFTQKDFESAFQMASRIAESKEWRIALLAEVIVRICPRGKLEELLRELKQ